MSTETFVYVLALVMGVLLGWLGGGGSQLTLPILVYAASVSPILATTYALFVIGITSLVSSVGYYRRQLIDFKAIREFVLPSLLGSFFVRQWVFPNLPIVLLDTLGFTLHTQTALMAIFAFLMLYAGIMLVTNYRNISDEDNTFTITTFRTWIVGFLIGSITSLVGTGGGFMILPILIFMLQVSIKMAIGTSLFIVCCNALVGFSTDVFHTTQIDWSFLLIFTVVVLVGMAVGSITNKHLSTPRLRKIFGYALVCMSFVILIKELLF